MPGPYYGGAPNAFAGGALFQQNRRQLDHQENALNALIARFGPEAADPTSWGQLQTIDQDAQLFPYEIGRQEHLRKVRPIELEEAQRGNDAGRALVGKYGTMAGDPSAWGQVQGIMQDGKLFPHVLGDAERRTDAYGALVQEYGPIAGDAGAHNIRTARNQELQSAALNAARGLQMAKAKGGDLGAAFDRSIAVLRGIGIPADAIASFREQIVSDPDFVDEFVAMLSDPERTGSNRPLSAGFDVRGPDGTPRRVIINADGSARVLTDESGDPFIPIVPEQRDRSLDQGDERIGLQDRQVTLAEMRAKGWQAEPGHEVFEDAETGEWYQRPMRGTPAEREVEDRDRRIRTEEVQRINAAQEVVERSDLALAALDNTLAQIDRWGAMQGGDGMGGRALRSIQGLPGVRALTDVGRYKDEVETLLSHVAIDRLASIKATGATLGQITAPELAMLRASMGNLEAVGRDPALIRQDIATIREILQKARANAQEDLGGAQPAGAPPPAGGDDDLEALLQRYGTGGGR